MRRRMMAPLVALAVIGATVAVIVGQQLGSGRNQGAFFHWAADTGGTREQIANDRTWITHHHRQVLAEGDRACSWISAQPNAPVDDPSRYYSVQALGDRYIRVTEATALTAVTASNRRTIAVEAWANLCHADRDPKIVVGTADEE
jgi:hypothetical protein